MYTKYWFYGDGKIKAMICNESKSIVEKSRPFPNATSFVACMEEGDPITSSFKYRAVLQDGKPLTDNNGKIVWELDEQVVLDKEISQAKEAAILELAQQRIGDKAKRPQSK